MVSMSIPCSIRKDTWVCRFKRTCDICGGYHEKVYLIEEFFLYPESRKVGNAMKAVCIKSYYAKRLKRQAAVGDELF
jgi:hypothetical protein